MTVSLSREGFEKMLKTTQVSCVACLLSDNSHYNQTSIQGFDTQAGSHV